MPLDLFDECPEGLKKYKHNYGLHFTEKMAQYAASLMYKKDPSSGKEEKIEPLKKDAVEELLKKHGIELKHNTMSDAVYVANMALADFYKSSVKTEADLALFIKDYVDDADQPDGFIFNRWLGDMLLAGIPIDWDELL